MNFPLKQDRGSAPQMPVILPGGVLPVVIPPTPAPWREYSTPAYAERFRCTASACEDTCCQGWSVPIDQATYEKYRASEVMRPHLGTLVVLNTNRPSTRDYARLASTASGACAFLDAEQMCGVQKQLGEEMLSTTCAVYPRVVSVRGGRTEKALHLSCPEAARLVLLDADALGLDWTRRPGPVRGADARLAVREFAVRVMVDRSYALWQRMYLLAGLVQRLEEASGGAIAATWCGRNPLALHRILMEYEQVLAGGKMRARMLAVSPQPAMQLALVAEMLRLRTAGPPLSARLLACMGEFEAGMGYATARSEADVMRAYAEGFGVYAAAMRSHPQLIENYLLNHILKSHYPFGVAGGPLDEERSAAGEQMQISLLAAMVQTLLIGMARHHGAAFGVAHVLTLVQSLARAVEHNPVYLQQIVGLGVARGLDGPVGAAMLLRVE